jgi:hypothetical protein
MQPCRPCAVDCGPDNDGEGATSPEAPITAAYAYNGIIMPSARRAARLD